MSNQPTSRTDTHGFTQKWEHVITEERLVEGIDIERIQKLLVGVRRLATAFDVSVPAVRAWLRQGLIPQPKRIGGRVLWDADELRAWIKGGCKPCPVERDTEALLG